MTCTLGGSHSFCCPLPLWPADAERWVGFCRSINARIANVRRTEGRDDIGTFSPPIPANVDVRPLPESWIAAMPANTDRREANGRYAARKAS